MNERRSGGGNDLSERDIVVAEKLSRLVTLVETMQANVQQLHGMVAENRDELSELRIEVRSLIESRTRLEEENKYLRSENATLRQRLDASDTRLRTLETAEEARGAERALIVRGHSEPAVTDASDDADGEGSDDLTDPTDAAARIAEAKASRTKWEAVKVGLKYVGIVVALMLSAAVGGAAGGDTLRALIKTLTAH